MLHRDRREVGGGNDALNNSLAPDGPEWKYWHWHDLWYCFAHSSKSKTDRLRLFKNTKRPCNTRNAEIRVEPQKTGLLLKRQESNKFVFSTDVTKSGKERPLHFLISDIFTRPFDATFLPKFHLTCSQIPALWCPRPLFTMA